MIHSAPPVRGFPHVKVILVAAVAENGVIGRDNALPWRLKSDMRHFRSVTSGRPVVMGRRTFQSIGSPLKQRTNIVVSGDPAFAASGVVVARNIAEALELARADAWRRGVDALTVIGGAGLFAPLMAGDEGGADVLEITQVHMAPEGDTFFPPIDAARWTVLAQARHEPGPDDDAAFTTITYDRAGAGA